METLTYETEDTLGRHAWVDLINLDKDDFRTLVWDLSVMRDKVLHDRQTQYHNSMAWDPYDDAPYLDAQLARHVNLLNALKPALDKYGVKEMRLGTSYICPRCHKRP